MKVRITTEREFPFSDINKWIRHCISIGIPLDEKKLKRGGYCEFECDNGYTKAHSRYEIVGHKSNKNEEILNRLEAVLTIISTKCSDEEIKCAYEELDYCISELQPLF